MFVRHSRGRHGAALLVALVPLSLTLARGARAEDDAARATPAAPETPATPAASAEPAPAAIEPAPSAEPAPTASTSASASEDAPVEFTVVGAREAETGGSVHSLKRKQLERFRYDDPARVLVTIPGVYARGEDGVGLRPNIGIRGGNSDRSKKVTLMEDGVLFGPAPYSAPAAYYFPLVARMRGIRVVKGPSAISYGPQTIGGAIDFATEEIPLSPQGSVDLAIGQFGYRKVHARSGLTRDAFGVLLEAIQVGTTGFKELDGGGDTGYLRRDWMAKASFQLPGSERVHHDLGIKLTYSSETSNETYLGLSDEDLRATPYRRYAASQLDRMEWNRTSMVATHHAELGGELEIVTNVYRHDFHRVWRKVNGLRGADIADVLAHPKDGANAIYQGVLTGARDATSLAEAVMVGPNERTFVSQGVQTVARWTTKRAGMENRLEYGLRLHYDEINRLHSQNGYLMTGGVLVADGRPAEVTADNTASTTALSFHVADAFSFGRLRLTPGVRVEIIRSRLDDRRGKSNVVGAEQVVLPGLGAYFALTQELGVLAGVHRGFSPPPPGSSSITRAEDSINWEAGARYTGKRLRAEVIGFYNDYRNLTDICTFSNGCVGASEDRQFDAGAVRIYGLEAFLETELRRGDVTFPARVAYTYTASSFLSSFPSADPQFGDVKEGDELPYVPHHQLSATVGAETKRWGLAAQLAYVSRMRETAGRGDFVDARSTDAYVVVDASGYVRLSKGVQLYVQGRNLGDATYLVGRRPFGARPGAPRWIQAGAKFDF